MAKQLSQRDEVPEIEIPSIGLGTVRTGASIMAVLLQAESQHDRMDILSDLASRFGISGADIQKRQQSVICKECGVADYLHPYDGCDWMGQRS